MASWEDGWKKQRSIRLFSDIDQNLSGQTIEQMYGLAACSNEPIYLWLNTNGGQVFHALAIVQAMKACPVTIITIAIGRVYSAGLIVMVTGNERLSFPGTMFMGHDFHYDITQGQVAYTDMLRFKKEADWLCERLTKHFLSHTKLTSVEQVKETFLSGENYFDEKTAIQLGVIDRIVETDFNITPI